MTTAFWARHAWVGDQVRGRVRITVGAGGVIEDVLVDADPEPGDEVLHGVVQPGAVNAHSHAFHRLLRGRTHGDGGSFWTWRDLMYREAARLDPERYESIATAVYGEMVAAGWTSVAEFHYVHHRVDGMPYAEPHAMELAIARAAVAAGIRLTLLDTCYLAGGFGAPLSAQQARFGDGTVERWLDRRADLQRAIESEFAPSAVVVGAALHSVRAVPVSALELVAARLDPSVPLHMHVSEQPAENADCESATGLTPVGLLDEKGLLSERFSAVHATHLSPLDIELLGRSGATVVMCPTTEADLGDGIGPASELLEAGARIALGTDQHAVVDPLLEARALEHGERLRSGRRGRFSPAGLVAALSSGGAASVGRSIGTLAPGHPADLIAVDARSTRTVGSDVDQLVLTGTASDVSTVVVGGRIVAQDGRHTRLGDTGALLAQAIEGLT